MKKLTFILLTLLSHELIAQIYHGSNKFEWFNNVSPQGKFIALSQENKIRVYTTADAEMVFKFDAPKELNAFSFSNDEKKIAILDKEHTVYTFDLVNGNQMWSTALKEYLGFDDTEPEIKNQKPNLAFSFSNNHLIVLEPIRREKDGGRGQENLVVALSIDAYIGDVISYKDETEFRKPITERIGNYMMSTQTLVSCAYSTHSSFESIEVKVDEYGEIEMDTWGGGKSTLSLRKIADLLAKDNGNVLMFYFEDKKINDNYVLTFQYNQYAVKYKNEKNTRPWVKARNDYKQFVSIVDGEVEVFNINPDDRKDFNPKKINDYSINLGGFAPIHFNNEILIAGDLDKSQFVVFDAKNGNELIRKDASEDFKYIGSAVALDYNKSGSGIYFNDDFDDNANGWEIRTEHERFAGSIENGMFKAKKGSSGFTELKNSNIGINIFRDFQIETLIKSSSGQFGLYWGKDENSGLKNLLLLNADGRYLLTRSNNDHKSVINVNWKDINVKTTEYNEVIVKCESGMYSISVNGVELPAEMLSGLYGSDAGIIYDQSASVELDKLTFTYLNKEGNTKNKVFSVDYSKPSPWSKLSNNKGTIENSALIIDNSSGSRIWPGFLGAQMDQQQEYELVYNVKIQSPGHAGIKLSGKSHYHDGIKFASNDAGQIIFVTDKNTASSSNFKANDFNELKVVKIKDKRSFYINGKLVEFGKDSFLKSEKGPIIRFIGLNIPGSSVVEVRSVDVSYLNPRKIESSKCKIYVAYRRDTGRASGPIKCKYFPAAYGDKRMHITWASENNISMDGFDNMEEYRLRWGNNSSSGTLNHPIECNRPCY